LCTKLDAGEDNAVPALLFNTQTQTRLANHDQGVQTTPQEDGYNPLNYRPISSMSVNQGDMMQHENTFRSMSSTQTQTEPVNQRQGMQQDDHHGYVCHQWNQALVQLDDNCRCVKLTVEVYDSLGETGVAHFQQEFL
jgi:hypothetical protein